MTVLEKEIIRNHPDFQSLTEEEHQLLEDNLYCRSYRKGQVLFDEGDERHRLFILKKGLVKIERIDSTGSMFYLEFFKDNTVFPLSGLFIDETYVFSAEAMTDIEVCYVSMKVFEKIVKENNQLLLLYFKKLSKLSHDQMLIIQNCVTSSAFQRVKNTLSMLMSELGEPTYEGARKIPYPLLITDISHYSGTTRETTSQVIKELAAEKKLTYLYKEFTFLDVEYFSEIFD